MGWVPRASHWNRGESQVVESDKIASGDAWMGMNGYAYHKCSYSGVDPLVG